MAEQKVKFGQIPYNVICRFQELTKTEFGVITFLYACRNDDSKQCNPSQKYIVQQTGLAKPHVSTAIKTLSEKGWIIESAEGFVLIENPVKVTKSVTKVTKYVTQKVTESVTEVTESVTKSYEIRNSHNKDWNIQETDNEQSSAEAEQQNAAHETIWDVWVEIDGKQGVLERAARGRLGKLIKKHGKERVATTLTKLREKLAVIPDAYAYLTATLNNPEPELSRPFSPPRYIGNNTIEIDPRDPMNPYNRQAVFD